MAILKEITALTAINGLMTLRLTINNKKAPRCDECGGLIRPDIVWFGEILPQETFSTGERKSSRKAIFVFIVGTSAVVYPAAYIPITAKQSGSYLVEVNIESTEISGYVDESFFGEAGKILPAILEEVKKLKPKIKST